MYDAWGGYNRGMQNLSGTLAQMTEGVRQGRLDDLTARRLALQEQEQQASLSDMLAKQDAIKQTYGGGSLSEAYAQQMQAAREVEETKNFMSTMKAQKDAGWSLESRQAWARERLAQNPKFAELAKHITFIDDEAMEGVWEFKDGEFPDPLRPGQTLPGGKYKIKALATGDPKNPFKLQGYEPYVEKYDAMELMDKRFAQQQQLQGQKDTAAEERLDRRLARMGGSDGRQDRIDARQTREKSYAMQKEMRNDKVIKAAKDSSQRLNSIITTFNEGVKTGNFTGSDQVMGYYINKVFDPDSVVMPSEFQRIAASQGLADKTLGWFQSIATGGIKLDNRSRKALINTVREVNRLVQARKSERVDEYRQDAAALGYDPDVVTGGRKEKEKPASKADSLRSKYGIGK